MEAPGEPAAGPPGAPGPSSPSAPGHPAREKLVKLEGGRDGGRTAGRSVGQRRGEAGQGVSRSRLLRPAPAPRPAPDPDPLYDVPGAGGGPAGGPPRPGRAVSLRERLLLTRPVWLQLRANAAAALHVLRTEPPGVSPPRPSVPPDWPGRGGAGTEVPSANPSSPDVPGAEVQHAPVPSPVCQAARGQRPLLRVQPLRPGGPRR